MPVQISGPSSVPPGAPGSRVLLTGTTYGVRTSETGRYLDLSAVLAGATTKLELWAQALTPGTATYIRLLLTGTTYGTLTEAGRFRLALGAVLTASEADAITRQPMVTIA